MSPEAVVGSAHSLPAVWKVSRQSPILGRLAAQTRSYAERQVGAWVAQHQFSYARRKECVARRSARAARSVARDDMDEFMEGESEEPTYGSPKETVNIHNTKLGSEAQLRLGANE